MEARGASCQPLRVVILSRDAVLVSQLQGFCASPVELAAVSSGFEAVAELLAAPVAGLVVDFRVLGPAHRRLLDVARRMDVEMLGLGKVPAGLDSDDLSRLRLVSRDDLPGALSALGAASPAPAAVEAPKAPLPPPAPVPEATPLPPACPTEAHADFWASFLPDGPGLRPPAPAARGPADVEPVDTDQDDEPSDARGPAAAEVGPPAAAPDAEADEEDLVVRHTSDDGSGAMLPSSEACSHDNGFGSHDIARDGELGTADEAGPEPQAEAEQVAEASDADESGPADTADRSEDLLTPAELAELLEDEP